MHNICQRRKQYLLPQTNFLRNSFSFDSQSPHLCPFQYLKSNLKSQMPPIWFPHIFFQSPLFEVFKIQVPVFSKKRGGGTLCRGKRGFLPFRFFFQNLAQSGLLKYIGMPLKKNKDKSYEMLLSSCRDRKDIDRQTDRQIDRHTDRLTMLITQNFNLVGLIKIA